MFEGVVSIKHRSSDLDLNEGDQTLSYYGGLKGQYVHLKDGKLQAISGNEKQPKSAARQGSVAASSQISLNVHDLQTANGHKSTFEEDFNKIQLAAARLVAIQELAKRKGSFSAEDNRVYAASLLELGQAAQNLAMLQQTGQIQDFSVLLQPMQSTEMPQKTPINGDKNIPDDLLTVIAVPQHEKVEQVTVQQLSESDLLPPNHEDPYEDVNDSVAITPPKKDASVAEAKPVGVSIAGEGGVASAKPNAVALSGRNGLAVSAPKATAIAGVTAEEAAAFSISLPSRHNLVIKSAPTRFSSPSYDDYYDLDSSPLQANTHNIPILRSAGTEKTRNQSKIKPMQATASAADAIVKMWRTAIAEDHATVDVLREHNNDFDIEKFFKISKQMNHHRRI